MSGRRQVLDFERPISRGEKNDLTVKRDKLVVEVICRVTGRTDWVMDDAMWARGKWVEYPDGELVFEFDGKERLLLRPPIYDREKNQWLQQFEFLFNKDEYQHRTAEDERG